MQDLITSISSKTGLRPETAERAVGILLGLLKTQGNQAKIDGFLAKLPGAAELAAKHGGDGADLVRETAGAIPGLSGYV